MAPLFQNTTERDAKDFQIHKKKLEQHVERSSMQEKMILRTPFMAMEGCDLVCKEQMEEWRPVLGKDWVSFNAGLQKLLHVCHTGWL